MICSSVSYFTNFRDGILSPSVIDLICLHFLNVVLVGFKNFRMWCLGRNTRLLHSAKYFLVYLVNGSLAGALIADVEEPMEF